MRIINAYDGREYRPGQWFPAPGVGRLQLVAVQDWGIAASACVKAQHDVTCHRIPLVVKLVRWERVAIIPT